MTEEDPSIVRPRPITRRRFIAGTGAAILGTALGAAGWWLRPRPAPPAISPIKHVVILIKENRSFDHLFGAFPGVEGARAGRYLGQTIDFTPGVQIMEKDLPHHWWDFRRGINDGAMDGFGRENEEITRYAYSQMEAADLPNYWRWAERFVLCDNFYASHGGPTFPNRLYSIAAQAAGSIDTPGGVQPIPGKAKTWGCDAQEGQWVVIEDPDGSRMRVPTCFDFRTMGDVLSEYDIDWASYSATETQDGYIFQPYSAIRHVRETDLWDRHIRAVDELIDDIREDMLPPVTWVQPRYPVCEHPSKRTSFCYGENWSTAVINAIMESPMWSDTVLFHSYDEAGGFYDHVPPPTIDAFGLGMRVPMLIISPYAKMGVVDNVVGEFASILRFIEDNWKLPHLTARDRMAGNLFQNFDFDRRPRPPEPLPLRTDCVGEKPDIPGI